MAKENSSVHGREGERRSWGSVGHRTEGVRPHSRERDSSSVLIGDNMSSCRERGKDFASQPPLANDGFQFLPTSTLYTVIGKVSSRHHLHDRSQTLEAQPGVHMLVGKLPKAAVLLPVVLDEHYVPDL